MSIKLHKKVAQLKNNKVRQSRIFFTERQYEKDKESKECHKKKKVRITIFKKYITFADCHSG